MPSTDNHALTEAIIDKINDAFVESNRAEFMDTDLDLPILHALVSLLSNAWHWGYGAGSSNVTDGWLSPGSPRATNPYAGVIPPASGEVQ